MAHASDSTRTPSSGGPVTRALYAMRAEPEPRPAERRLFLRALAALPFVGSDMSTTRRTFLAGTAPVVPGLTGTVIGVPAYRGAGPDLSGPAEAWLNDAFALGLWVGLGPDGKLWQCSSVVDGSEREAARQQHRIKLYARPCLKHAVRNLALSGYQQQVIA